MVEPLVRNAKDHEGPLEDVHSAWSKTSSPANQHAIHASDSTFFVNQAERTVAAWAKDDQSIEPNGHRHNDTISL